MSGSRSRKARSDRQRLRPRDGLHPPQQIPHSTRSVTPRSLVTRERLEESHLYKRFWLDVTAGSLRFELHGDVKVHGSGLAIKDGRLVFPLLDGVGGCAVEQRRSGENFEVGDVAIGVDEAIDGDVAGDVLGLGDLRIHGSYGLDELSRLHVASDRKRGGRLWAVRRSHSSQAVGRRSGIGIDRRERLAVGFQIGTAANDRRGQMDVAERRLFRRFGSGSSRRIVSRRARGPDFGRR